MNRGLLVGVVLVPLILGFACLIFAISTERWVKLDYNRIRNDTQLNNLNQRNNYVVKQVRMEFPKFTSLYGECDEYRLVEILVPVPVANKAAPSTIKNNNNNTNDEACLTQDECNSGGGGGQSCFCCQVPKNRPNYDEDRKCCFPASNRCDGIQHCHDKTDELHECPQRKIFYSTKWYDSKHDCLRHQYNLLQFAKHVLRWNERFNKNPSTATSSSSSSSSNAVSTNVKKVDDDDDDYDARRQLAADSNEEEKIPTCLLELYKTNNYSIRIFLFRVASLLSFILCGIFTILCMLTLLCVTCCKSLREKKQPHSDDETGGAMDTNYGGGASEEDEAAPIARNNKGPCCCLCNCVLCPFVFFSIFAICAFVACAFGLAVYMFSLCYARYAYLVYDADYIPEYLTQAYQSNSWLFDVHQFGISFYAILVAFVMYLLVLILSTCISCRIQMSPTWRHRNSSSYEVLQMQDLVINSKKIYADEKNSEKEEAKRKKKREKEAKKEAKKKSKKDGGDEQEHERLSNGGGGGAGGGSDETQTLTTPKTRIIAIDESYE